MSYEYYVLILRLIYVGFFLMDLRNLFSLIVVSVDIKRKNNMNIFRDRY